MDIKYFKTVSLANNTLTWEKVRKDIKTKSGKTFNVAFDLDPLLLYENSKPDIERNERYKIGKLIRSERESRDYTRRTCIEVRNNQELYFQNRK